MPNIRSQIIDSNHIEIVASDGRTFTVTRAQILANFQSQTGTVAQRVVKTVNWFKASVVAILGAEQIDPSRLMLQIATATGAPVRLQTGYTRWAS